MKENQSSSQLCMIKVPLQKVARSKTVFWFFVFLLIFMLAIQILILYPSKLTIYHFVSQLRCFMDYCSRWNLDDSFPNVFTIQFERSRISKKIQKCWFYGMTLNNLNRLCLRNLSQEVYVPSVKLLEPHAQSIVQSVTNAWKDLIIIVLG